MTQNFQPASANLSHLDNQGSPDGGCFCQRATIRQAVAAASVRMLPETFEAIQVGMPKGDVLGTARLAGIMAAKHGTNSCHPLPHKSRSSSDT